MQEDLKDMETQTLIDMLAKHTETYTKLMSDGSREDFERCKETIAKLQTEINSRHRESKDPNS